MVILCIQIYDSNFCVMKEKLCCLNSEGSIVNLHWYLCAWYVLKMSRNVFRENCVDSIIKLQELTPKWDTKSKSYICGERYVDRQTTEHHLHIFMVVQFLLKFLSRTCDIWWQQIYMQTNSSFVVPWSRVVTTFF